MIDFGAFRAEDGTPIYLQIIKYLKQGVVSGAVADGDELPSRRVLSALLGLNPNTVQKACRMLEEEGLLVSHAGAKSCVRVTPELRERMGAAAVKAAKAVGYENAGTVEFLLDPDREHFYFMEMNTRLQVEHPITEEVVGVDLVKEQIRIANDEVLHLKQEELFQRGHAIECRICTEDTENNFMPSPGVIKQLTEPNGIGVRIDSYVYDGYEIPIYYDPMIGKLIVWATTRQYAIERMRRVLYEYKITGVKTNLAYLKRIMHVPDFVKGEYNTLFIEKNARMLVRTNTTNEELENIAMIAAYMDYLVNLEENVSAQLSDGRPISRWREFGLQKGVLRI